MTSLRDFIAARLDEDEAAAIAAGSGRWVSDYRGRVEDKSTDDWRDHVVVYDEGAPTEEQAVHIARHDPARVLREVAAKRAILAWAQDDAKGGPEAYPPDDLVDVIRERALTPVLKHLASAWSDHPDFDPNWSTT